MLKSTIICKQTNRYIGWPTVARGPQGQLYAVFSGDRAAHVCPFGKVWLIRSLDDGDTWSEPILVADTPLDDRDAGLCVLPDGTLVVGLWTSHYEDYRSIFERFFVPHLPASSNPEKHWEHWREVLDKITPDVIQEWAPSYRSPDGKARYLGFWTLRSKDGGLTWDQPKPSPVYAPHGPAALPNGDLLYVGMKALSRLDGEKNIGVARSRDQGKTWEVLANLTAYPPYRGRSPEGYSRLAEPHVTACQSGRLVAMARYEQANDPGNPYRSMLWQFESEDGGYTWTEPHQTPVVGKPPHLLTLANGNLLVSYGYRHQPFGQRACLSQDEGRTWDYAQELVLRDDAINGDLGYPSTVECRDGGLLSVYYQVDQPGEMPCLWQTKTGPDYSNTLTQQSHPRVKEAGSGDVDAFTM